MARTRLRLLFTAALVLAAAGWSRATPPEGKLVVTLNPVARPKGTLLRLGDMALLSGPTHLREKAAALDVAERPAVVKDPAVSRQEVYYRLLLAGFSPESFRLAGPHHTAVRWEEATTPPGAIEKAGAAAPEGTPLVKARDVVRLMVRIGTVQVSARGEAQQEGRLGQTIRVRNVDSGKTVTGRVVDRNLVEVVH